MSSTTTTLIGSSLRMLQLQGESEVLPKKLEPGFLHPLPKLDAAQAGHLRHFHNLVTQKDGQWNHMGSQEPGQEWNDAYRYQLATMAYAAGLCHYHRMPALRSAFKTLLEQLVHKMLLRDVWGYWFLTSHSGVFVDPSITELRRPWANPVKKENIMYSGHLLLMTALHAMLFADDKFDKPGALNFTWAPLFWGLGPERFTYNISSLQELILTQMEKEKWLGVCCEPNCIFVVCNQFPMIAFRYEDVRKGTKISEEVTQNYLAAWEKLGMVQETGLLYMYFSPKQQKKMQTPSIGSTAWTSAFMNAWNPSFAKSSWSQAVGFLSRVEKDRVNLNSDAVAHSIRQLVHKEKLDPHAPETIARAQEMAKLLEFPSLGLLAPTYGYVVQWASEVGDRDILDGLLNHADRFMNPTVERGGLFYPVNVEARVDKDGNYVQVDAYTGNAAIGYARLNVFDGQRKMYASPWTKEHVSSVPHIDNLQLGDGVDFLRGEWNEGLQAMVLTMRSWDGTKKTVKPYFSNLKSGIYGIYINGDLKGIEQVSSPTSNMSFNVDVDETETDVVLLRRDSS